MCHPPIPGPGSSEHREWRAPRGPGAERPQDHDSHLPQCPLGWMSVVPALPLSTPASRREEADTAAGSWLEFGSWLPSHLRVLFSSDWGEVPRKRGHVQADSIHRGQKMEDEPQRDTHSLETERNKTEKRRRKRGQKGAEPHSRASGVQVYSDSRCLHPPHALGLVNQPAQPGSSGDLHEARCQTLTALNAIPPPPWEPRLSCGASYPEGYNARRLALGVKDPNQRLGPARSLAWEGGTSHCLSCTSGG